MDTFDGSAMVSWFLMFGLLGFAIWRLQRNKQHRAKHSKRVQRSLR